MPRNTVYISIVLTVWEEKEQLVQKSDAVAELAIALHAQGQKEKLRL